uniref:Reverse transcriptase domain-containing protein n=1 Tax=Tanacetum cinerariifolium TaxID=118510 RepID=A0A6L2P1G6_TANCI|nr:hypothetical protein [Tanacetum cinerariifolium]
MRMCIQADKSTQIPRGIAENVTVKIDRFVFPVDFVVLDIKEGHKIPIILERPFLATTHAMIDVFNKKISFKVGNKTITYDIEKSMRFPPSDDDTCHSVDIIYLSILNHVQEILPSEPFNSFLFEPINLNLPIKINSLWDDNKGEQDLINHISENLKHESEGLNPKVKEVVKAKIVKLLDAGLIYAISKSPWDAKPRLRRWVLLLQEFTIEIRDKKGSKNLAADHLSRLENPKLEELDEDALRDSFPDEHLMLLI